jgi:hypothetical protein
LFDESKKDVKTEIAGLDDRYKFSAQLLVVAGQIDAKSRLRLLDLTKKPRW